MMRVQLVVSGRVQGVSYRWHTRARAADLGLTGWVRNRREGTVEVLAAGPRPQLEALISWCRTGSPAAEVDEVDVSWVDGGELQTFHIADTV